MSSGCCRGLNDPGITAANVNPADATETKSADGEEKHIPYDDEVDFKKRPPSATYCEVQNQSNMGHPGGALGLYAGSAYTCFVFLVGCGAKKTKINQNRKK